MRRQLQAQRLPESSHVEFRRGQGVNQVNQRYLGATQMVTSEDIHFHGELRNTGLAL